MNEKDEQSLLGFVREAAANVNKNGSEPMPVPIRQTRRILGDWAASLTGARVPRKRPRPSAVSFVTFQLRMSQQTEGDVDQRPTVAAQITTEGGGDPEPFFVAEQPSSDDDGETLPARYSFSDDHFDVRFATATADATTTEIANEIEKLLRTETQAEAEQLEDRSVAARPSVNQLETGNAPAPRQETMPSIESIAGQGERVTAEEDVPSVAEIGIFGAVHVPAENAGPKLSKNAEEICEYILEGLRRAEGFPETGVDLTVYGFGAYWNAMMIFAPGATTFARASVYRKVLPLLVAELRKRFDLT